MKNIIKILSIVVLSLVITGCKDTIVTRKADLSDKDANLVINPNGVNSITKGELYDYIKNNDKETAFNLILEYIVEENFMSEPHEIEWYQNQVNKKMLSLVTGGEFNLNGEFDESTFANYLRSNLYSIDEDSTTDYLDSKYFTYNYDDFINKTIKYELYQDILIADYIINEKAGVLTRSNYRKLTYYEITKDTSKEPFKTLNDLTEAVKDLYDGIISDLQDIENRQKDTEKQLIVDDFEKLMDNPGSEFYSLSQKFSTCGDKMCLPEESKNYQLEAIDKKEYVKTEIVNNKNDSLFDESIRNRLFANNVQEKLFGLGDSNYLTHKTDTDKNFEYSNTILSVDNNLYIVKVELIDFEDETSIDRIDAALLLKGEVTTLEVFEYYFKDYEIEIYDEDLVEYIESKYTKQED